MPEQKQVCLLPVASCFRWHLNKEMNPAGSLKTGNHMSSYKVLCTPEPKSCNLQNIISRAPLRALTASQICYAANTLAGGVVPALFSLLHTLSISITSSNHPSMQSDVTSTASLPAGANVTTKHSRHFAPPKRTHRSQISPSAGTWQKGMVWVRCS